MKLNEFKQKGYYRPLVCTYWGSLVALSILLMLFFSILSPKNVFATATRENCDYEKNKTKIITEIQSLVNEQENTTEWKLSTRQSPMWWDCTEKGLIIYDLLIELPIESNHNITYIALFESNIYNGPHENIVHQVAAINIDSLRDYIELAEEQIAVQTFGDFFEAVNAYIDIPAHSTLFNKVIGEQKIDFVAKSIEEGRKADYTLEFSIDPESNEALVYRGPHMPNELIETGVFAYKYPPPSIEKLNNHNNELVEEYAFALLRIAIFTIFIFVGPFVALYFIIRAIHLRHKKQKK